MSLHLHFAPDAELLRQQLASELVRSWKEDPLTPPKVLVPNPFVKRWLMLRMAGQMGSVLGFSPETLERAIWKWLAPGPHMRRLQSQELQLALLRLLDDELLGEKIFTPVRSYLLGDRGVLDEVKRLQLAGFLSRLFQEYEFNRPSVWDREKRSWVMPGLTASWLKDRPYDFQRPVPEPVRIHEAWQSELFRRSVGLLRETDNRPGGVRLISLPQLLEERRQRDPGWSLPPGDIALFMVPKISHWHRNLLVDVSQMPGVELQVFLTNPCAEFWEDVDTWSHRVRNRSTRKRWRSSDPAGPDAVSGIGPRRPEDYQRQELEPGSFAKGDPRLLELWGHSARENISLWCPAAEWDFEYHAPPGLEDEPGGASCLQALQRSLLRREADLSKGASADASLQVLAAPELGREVEELREQLLDALRDKADTGVGRLEDAVVYATDLSAYLPHIHRVFGATSPRDPGHIAYNIIGAPGQGSLYAQAVEALLTMLEGRFDRAAVFTLLRNPVWQACSRVGPAEVACWEAWAAGTGMTRGFDAAHRAAMGDLGDAASDVHSFGMGMARLLAGGLAEGLVELGFRVPVRGFRDFSTGDSGSMERFLAAIEGLYRDFGCWDDRLSPAQAASRLRELLDKWLPELPAGTQWNLAIEGRVRKDFLAALNGLQELSERLGLGPMSRPALLALIRGLLPEELPAGSKAWLGGVTFAPLRMGLVLPHPLVCVLGLGAGVFPGSVVRSELDLLAVVRKVGDSHPVRDNQLTFLELLHAARGRLVLSWRAQDLQKEAELFPSSVLQELLDYLGSQGVHPVRSLPLNAWEALARTDKDAPPTRSWSAREHGIAAAASRKRAVHRFPAIHVSAPRPKEKTAAALPLSDLQVFFENPLQHHVARVLGLKGEEEGSALSVRDEPLDLDSLQTYELQSDLWTSLLAAAFPERAEEAVTDGSGLTALLEREAERLFQGLMADGSAPAPPLDRSEKARLVRWGMERIGSLTVLSDRFADHRLLNNADLSLCRKAVPRFLALGKTRLSVSRQLVLAPRSATGACGLLRFGGKDERAADDHRLWLAAITQALHERSLPETLRMGRLDMVLLSRYETAPDKQVDISSLRGFDHEGWPKLNEWLEGMVAEMQSGHAEHLPFVCVRKTLKADIEEYLNGDDADDPFQKLSRDALQEELDDGRSSAYRCHDEAWKLVEARLPPDDDLIALARRRFEPLLLRWLHD